MDIIWKSVIGGLFTALIIWTSKRGNVLPGILPLFPKFVLIALYIIGMKGGTDNFQETCLSAIKTIPAYTTFLIVCYFSIKKLDFRLALLLGLASWFVITLLIFIVPKHFH